MNRNHTNHRVDPSNVMDSALAVIGTYQECIDKILEAINE